MHPAANLGLRAAAGGTAGGSTDDRIIFFVAADYGADRGHSSSAGGGRHADLQGFLRGQSSTGVEQIVDIPGGGLQGFRPGQSSSASFSSPAGVPEIADEPGEGFFSYFPDLKKVRRSPGTRVRECPRQSSSSTLSSHQMARAARPQDLTDDGNIFREDDEKFWVRLDTGQLKLLCTDIVVDQPWP